MTTATAATWPLYVALADAINADATLQSLLAGDRVYSLRAPAGALFDYVVLGNANETEWYAFADGGSTCVITLNLWCAADDARTCAVLYGHLHRVLQRQRIAVDGFKASMIGDLSLVSIENDPQDGYVHGVARYGCTVFRA
jgi:hypothetical protein